MNPYEEIEALRKKIDTIDAEIVRLLNQRALLAKEIHKVKKNNSLPLYDPKREEEIFENLSKANQGPLFDEAFREIYETILQWMKSLEEE